MTAMGFQHHYRHTGNLKGSSRSTSSVAASSCAPKDQLEFGRGCPSYGPYESTVSDSLSSISSLHSNQPRPPNTNYDYDYNHYDERTPLNPDAHLTGPKKRVPQWNCGVAFVVIIVTLLLSCLGSFYTGRNSGVAPGLTLDDMEKLRRNWILEFTEHEEERKTWEGERMSWEKNRLEHEKELEELGRQKERERSDWQIVRKAWDQERLEHDEELREERERVQRERIREYEAWEAMRMAWECERLEHEKNLRKERQRERLEHEEQLQKEREELERQRNQEREAWELLRKEWERERLEHDEESRREREEKERESEERRRHEEQEKLEREERIRLGLYWDEVQGSDHCYASGTREYTARLMNLPTTYDGMKGCRNVPITIHDVTVDHPYKCENRGFSEGIYGYFLVTSGETACSPYWGGFEDKGCTTEGLHTRQIESRLWNIQEGENWNQICSTTPADLRNLHFEGPRYCEDKGMWGVYGVWEVEDSEC